MVRNPQVSIPAGESGEHAPLFPSFHYMWDCGPRALSFGESWFVQEEPTQEKRTPACLHSGTWRVSPLSAMVWGFWLFTLKRTCQVFAVAPCSCVELWVIVQNWGQELHSAPRARTSPCLLNLEWFLSLAAHGQPGRCVQLTQGPLSPRSSPGGAYQMSAPLPPNLINQEPMACCVLFPNVCPGRLAP